jgi:hypothetical protein
VLPRIVESIKEEIAIVLAYKVDPDKFNTVVEFVRILDPMTLDTVIVLPTIDDAVSDEICNVLTTIVEATTVLFPIIFVIRVVPSIELNNGVLRYSVEKILPILNDVA